MPKDTVQPLKLEVYDEDLVGDEMIGYATADLSQCFLNPQKWSFNEVLNLSGDLNMQNKYKTQLFGKVYLQIMFCLQGVDCQDPPLPLTEDIDEILREKAEENKKPIKGSLLINVPLAMGVKAADSSTQTSDPYCKITLPDGHTIETKQVEKTLDPIWNFTYKWNCNIIKE
jgi:Ca2+-dependent lipid-binding protein